MASVVQVLLSLPEFKQRYYDNAEQFMQMNVAEPPKNFHLQMYVRLGFVIWLVAKTYR